MCGLPIVHVASLHVHLNSTVDESSYDIILLAKWDKAWASVGRRNIKVLASLNNLLPRPLTTLH